ncbi:MAG: hypothetical protein AAGE84_03995 [Cyanobacteria bacterium P01_G01_bin.39]
MAESLELRADISCASCIKLPTPILETVQKMHKFFNTKKFCGYQDKNVEILCTSVDNKLQ